MKFKDSKLNNMLDENRVRMNNSPAREYQLTLEDHRDELLNSAEIRYLTVDEKEIYKFRPMDYLTHIDQDPTMWKLVLWLNQIRTIMEFKDIEYLYIPNKSTIEEIYTRYRNFTARLTGSESKFSPEK